MNRNWIRVLRAALLLGACACSEDPPDDSEQQDHGSAGSSQQLYAVMFEVFTADGSDSYLSLFDSLDIDELDTSEAREFGGGRAYLQAYGDWVFVGEPDTPVVHRYTVGKGGELTEERDLSFARFGFEQASIDDWVVNFISPTKAYYFAYEEGTTIVWNPSTMAIEGEIPAPDGYLREGFTPNQTPGGVRGKRLFRSVFWENDATTQRSEDQMLVVYDTDTDEIVDTVKETRCRALGNRVFSGEDGTLYFSNWIWPVADTILYGAPDHCVLRIRPGEQRFDPAWSLAYSDIADGRDGGMFTYLKDGQGLASIFHDEEVPHDMTTDPYELAGSPNWELWNVDIERKTGAPLPGIPRNTGAYTPITLDGRTFVMIPDQGWENTQLYEIDGGEAKPSLSIPGWSYMLVQLR